jgi:long-chain acyl-CoA synthetase
MNQRTFSDYVADLDQFAGNLALTSRSFLKIERVTHHELRLRSYQTAHYLIASGVQRGDRVMVVATNSPEWVELLLGTLLIGGVLVPVDASSSAEVTMRFARETSPKIVFAGRNLHLDGGSDFATHFLDELGALVADSPRSAPAVAVEPEWPAVIVFTSGTTADPKGVVLTQENILANIAGILARIDVGQDWRLLSVLPLSHMYEMSGSLSVLARGASIFYMPRVTPQAIVQSLGDYQINVMLAIPQLLSLMLERIQQTAQERGQAKLFQTTLRIAGHLPFALRRILFHSVHSQLGGCLRIVVTGGAPIPIDVATTWERMGVLMVQGYGLTETSPILSGNGLSERRLDSAGRALDNVQLRIGEDGEIQAEGPSVFHGYWHDESATRAAFTEDGWFRTGDVGRLEDGWLFIQGRLKFAVVRSSGLKVFPEDVEVVAEKEPLIREICIVGLKDQKGESVLAVLVADGPDQVVNDAIARINAQLEPFQHIDGWRRWPESDFPRTRLLKIDRRQVEEWANAGEAVAPAKPGRFEAGEDPLVHVIRLSLDDPGAVINDSDRLADLGLDSLRRLTAISMLEEQLGVSISDDAVTPETTVEELRQLAGEGSPVEASVRAPHWPYWRWVRFVGNGLRETVLRGIVRIWVRTSVEGGEGLADFKGPALFIFNHSDDFDGPVVYHALPRTIRTRLAVATADDVLRDHKMLALLARVCFAGFSFARSEPYLPSLEYVGEMVDRGWNVLISPEGRLSTTGRLQPFKSGIGLLAVSLGVPVIPVKTIGLAGTVPLHAKWPKRRSRVTVRIGQPMYFGPQMNYADVTEALYRAVEDL